MGFLDMLTDWIFRKKTTVETRTDNTAIDLMREQMANSEKRFTEFLQMNKQETMKMHALYENQTKQFAQIQEEMRQKEEKNFAMLQDNLKQIDSLNKTMADNMKENVQKLQEKEDQVKELMGKLEKTSKEYVICAQELKDLNDAKEKEKVKMRKAQDEFEAQKEMRLREYMDTLLKSLGNREKAYFDQALSKYNLNDIESLMANIFKAEKVADMCYSFIIENAQTKSFNLLSSMNHLNIVLGGKTGVGKSSLINSFLQLPMNERAKIGIGKPVTRGKPKEYTSKTIPTFRLWDTQGIEISEYGIQAVVDDIFNLVNKKALENEPDTFIHAIWYCVSIPALRFEGIEKDSLLKLMKLYEGGKLPVIVVLTQSYDVKDVTAMEHIIREDIPASMDIIPVVAKAKNEVQSFGLDNLLRLTGKRACQATNSACYHSIKMQLQKEFSELEDKLIQKAEAISKETILKKSQELQLGMNLEVMFDQLSSILLTITSAFLSFQSHSFVPSSDTKKLIGEIMRTFNQMAQETLRLFKQKETDQAVDELTRIYLTMHNAIEKQNECSLSSKKSETEWKKEATKEIEKIIAEHSELKAYTTLASFVSVSYINIISGLFKKILNETLKNMTKELETIAQEEVTTVTEAILAKTMSCSSQMNSESKNE